MRNTFWSQNGQKILTFLAIILAAGVAFRAGQNYQKTQDSAQIKVSINQLEAANPREEKLLALERTLKRKGVDIAEESRAFSNNGQESPGSSSSGKEGTESIPRECSLVGSKNSDKYHQPDCQWSKRIKEENKVCFDSPEHAEAQGYQPAKCCH
jgi:micrococcal nuclease